MAELEKRTDADEAQIVANGERLLALYDRYSLTAPPPNEDWETFARACLARVRHSTGVILGLLPDHPTERIPLARCVYEHAVTFAWLLIDPEANQVCSARFGWPPQREVLRAFTSGFVPEELP